MVMSWQWPCLNRGDQDDSNDPSRLKIGPLLRKLWAKIFRSVLMPLRVQGLEGARA